MQRRFLSYTALYDAASGMYWTLEPGDWLDQRFSATGIFACGRGETLVHFSPQPEPCLSLTSSNDPMYIPQKALMSSRKVDACFAPGVRRRGGGRVRGRHPSLHAKARRSGSHHQRRRGRAVQVASIKPVLKAPTSAWYVRSTDCNLWYRLTCGQITKTHLTLGLITKLQVRSTCTSTGYRPGTRIPSLEAKIR
jgi:hypothetical protein